MCGRPRWPRLAGERPVGNAGYELTLTLPKSFSLYAVTGDPARRGEWLDVMEAAATRALERLMAEAGFCSTGHRGDGQDVQHHGGRRLGGLHRHGDLLARR